MSTIATEEGLRRRLRPRQIAMMAIGSAIGVGLFLGSTVTIGLAGPAVILTYVIGAVIALVMGYALAEMAVVHPVAGSFGVFADRYLSPWFGFVVRATYAFIQILAIGAEVTAVAIYFAFWFPRCAAVGLVVGHAAALVAINTAQVGRFGEFEYWFALIKVVAIVAFIAVGLAVITGFGPGPAVGFRNLFDGPGGFLPHGWRGVWLALTLVITSYMGIEVIAVTAGEAEHPETSIPRAMRTMVLRLILFYVLAIGVMLMMTPWRELAEGGGGHHRQPVRAGVRGHRDSVCRRRDEPRRDLGGALERELEPLHDDAHAVLAVAIRVTRRAGWLRSAPTACRCARVAVASAGVVRRDSAGDLRAGQRVPGAVRHGRRRHAVHLDRDPVHVSALPAALPAGSAGAAADQDARAPRGGLASASCRSSPSR